MRPRSPAIWIWLASLLFLIFLLVPGPADSSFSGAPLRTRGIVCFLAALVVSVFAGLYAPRRRVKGILLIGLAALIPVKVLLSSQSVPIGWRGTYFPASYLGQYQATFFFGFSGHPYRIDSRIDFERSNFGLYFLNDAERYGGDSHHRATDLPRDFAYPLTVQWTGFVTCPAAGALSLEASARGSFTVAIDGRKVFEGQRDRLSPVAPPWPVPAGVHSIAITYSKPALTDPGIHVSEVLEAGVSRPLPVTPWPSSESALRRSSLAGDVATLGGVLACILLAWSFAGAYWPMSPLVRTRVLADPPRAAAYLLFVALVAYGFVKALGFRHTTVILSVGNDPLGFESLARAGLYTGLLMKNIIWPPAAFFYYPLYAYVLAGAHLLFGEDFTTVILVNFCCLGFAVLLAWGLALRRMSTRAALAGLVAFGVFTRFRLFTYADTAFSDNLFLPLVFVALILCLRALESDRGWVWGAAGVASALAAAARPSFLLFVPCLLLAMIVRRGRNLAPRLRSAVLFTAGFAAGVFPFTLRNWLVAKKFVLLVNYVALPYLLYAPEEARPELASSMTQSLSDCVRIIASRPVAVLKLESRKLLHTLGATQVGPPGSSWHADLLALTLLFGLAVLLKRIPKNLLFVFVVFAVSHVLASVIAVPWTYGYKTILPLHAVFLLGATFLLTPRGERAVTGAPSRVFPSFFRTSEGARVYGGLNCRDSEGTDGPPSQES